MVTELGLSGKALLLYALIYGFSQDKGCGYSGRQDYLMEWLQCTRQSITNIMGKLVQQGLIAREQSETGAVIYRTTPCKKTLHEVKKVDMACQKTLPEEVKKLDVGCQKTLHPTIYNTTDNTIYNHSCSRGTETSTAAPTVEEVAAYCRERGNAIDANRFVDYYAVSGWKLRGKPIEDWRALIRLWEQNGRANKAAPGAETSAAGNDGNGKSDGEASKPSFDTDDFWAAALRKSYGG